MSTSSPTLEAQGRAREAMERWRRRSRLIHFLRKALPAAMGGLLLILVGWIAVKSIIASLTDLARSAAVIHMTNPRFYGQDEHGRNFLVGAKEATRAAGVSTHIMLTGPEIKFAGGGQHSLEVTAREGDYSDVSKQVALKGDVVIKAGDGTTLKTNLALIDVRSGQVSGNSPIVGTGPLGQINASSYAVYDRGARAVFTGQVHAHLTPHGQ